MEMRSQYKTQLALCQTEPEQVQLPLMHTLRRLPESVWHLLIVSLWGLPLVTPLLRWTAVPCTHDGHLHYHRIAAMRHAWEYGL
jgi:hypothetical protein